MTNNNIGNDGTIKINNRIYSQSQISPEDSSLIGVEVLPISDDMDEQTLTMQSDSLQPTDLNSIKEAKENFSSQNNSDFKRKPTISKAERRAEHNAIERARRECLNSKFQQLAEILPNLHHHRRPSKGQIVEKALDWVKQNISKEDRYQYQVLQLQNENKHLLDQINLLQQKVSNNSTTAPLSPVSPVYPVYAHHLLPNIYQNGESLNSKENYSFYPPGNSINQVTTSEYNFHQNIQMGLDQSQKTHINDDDNDSSSSDENTCDKNITCNQSLNYNMVDSNYTLWDKSLQAHQRYFPYQTEPISERIYLHNSYTL
ncbi:hypothetical protein K501DRAFT_336813 [Backusella circina FSU 941]|nr:hypothetical protein K501DRAFT_336813 [Backusella circina FSU 941]